ncbi:MAG: hypothetical protein IKT41_01285 [Clostridia bacterium]|nr:hypothetical protein [Clostridia bacterium]
MNNAQLTQEVMNLKEQQAKSIAEHEKFEMILAELQEDVKATKALAEDVHIMAINMQNMQKTMEETNRKVDALSSKEYVEYKENKKLIKQNIISKVTGAVIGALGTGIIWLIATYITSH